MQTPCLICSQLRPVQTSFYKYAAPEYDIPLPAAAAQLVMVKDLSLADPEQYHLRRCPNCGTLYTYRVSYEYIVNGSEDEEALTRMTAEEASEYCTQQALRLEKMRQMLVYTHFGAGSLVDYLDHGNPSQEEEREARQSIEAFEHQSAQAREQLCAQVDAFRLTCPEILQRLAEAHQRACQFYLEHLPQEGLDAPVAGYVAKSSLEAWQQFVLGAELPVDDPSAWLEGYSEQVEQGLLI